VRAHRYNLAHARPDSLGEGFLSLERGLLCLSEIDGVDWISVCFQMFSWCATLQSHVRCLVCIIYGTMGMKWMILV